MHEVLVNRKEGLSLPRKSVVRFTERPDRTLDVHRGRKNNNTTQLSSYTNAIQLARPKNILNFNTICRGYHKIPESGQTEILLSIVMSDDGL